MLRICSFQPTICLNGKGVDPDLEDQLLLRLPVLRSPPPVHLQSLDNPGKTIIPR